MVEKLNTSLTISLDDGSGSETIPQKWEVHYQGCSGGFRAYFQRCYRLYPARAAGGTQVASYGTLTNTGDTQSFTQLEYIKFNNSDRASGNYPIVGDVEVDLQYAFDGNGVPLRNVGFRHDPDTYEIVASQPFFGAVHTRYRTDYAIFSYEPEVQVPHGGGYFAQYGNLLNFFNNNMVEIEVVPPSWDEDIVRYELYRVTSNLLLNKHGNWETPYDWASYVQGQKAWPTFTTSPVKGGNGAENARVHEIGYFFKGSGVVTFDQAFVPLEAPKVGDTWRPTYEFAWSQTLEAAQNDDDMMRTLNLINFETVTDRVRDVYSNVTGLVDFFTGSQL